MDRIRILALFLAAAMLTGCGRMSNSQAEALLEERYNEEFTVTGSKNGSRFTVIPKKHPGICFRLEGSSEYGYSDTYITELVCDRLSRKIQENMEGLDAYIFTEAMLTGTTLTDTDATLEEYMEDGPNKFTIFVFLDKDSKKDEVLDNFTHMFDGIMPINGSVAVYLADKGTMEDVQEYVQTHDDQFGEFFEWTDPMSGGTIQFEDSQLPVSEVSEGYGWLEKLE